MANGDGSILDDPTQNPYTVNMERGEESALSSWAGPYVTEMLGRGEALSKTPYVAYGGI